MKLLMVCSGNICRSPMAEILAPMLGDRMGVDVRAKSAGTLGLVDRPADAKSVAVCRELGLDLRAHRSQPLTEDLVAWADRILVMELTHAGHVREFFPSGADKVLQLGPFAGLAEIPDPIGGWTFQFRRCRDQIQRGLEEFLRRVA